MNFRFFTNAAAQATRNFAVGLFIVGLLLIGFGVLVVVFSEIFAFLAAMIFFIVGLGCGITAIKIFWTQRQLNKFDHDGSQDYRDNVQIHMEDYYDL